MTSHQWCTICASVGPWGITIGSFVDKENKSGKKTTRRGRFFEATHQRLHMSLSLVSTLQERKALHDRLSHQHRHPTSDSHPSCSCAVWLYPGTSLARRIPRIDDLIMIVEMVTQQLDINISAVSIAHEKKRKRCSLQKQKHKARSHPQLSVLLGSSAY